MPLLRLTRRFSRALPPPVAGLAALVGGVVAAMSAMSAMAAPEAPPPPAVFGIRLGDQPSATRARLRAAGYASRAMTNSGGCVAESFDHTSADAPMTRVTVWHCGPEQRAARLDIEGHAGETFHRAVRERFHLGPLQREGDPVGPRYGNYARDFAKGVRLTLTATRGDARLRLEDPEALARAADQHQEDVRHLEETADARERERRKQRDTFF